jgi:hypothetical protein
MLIGAKLPNRLDLGGAVSDRVWHVADHPWPPQALVTMPPGSGIFSLRVPSTSPAGT